MMGRPKLVLASGSPRRLSLINQAGVEPDSLEPAEIDETPERGELPRTLSVRLAREKALKAQERIRTREDLKGAFILAADTVVSVGRRIMPKPEGVCLVTPNEAVKTRLVETRVRFKRLSEQDIESYLASGEWRNKAGGYAIQGLAGTFVVKLVGSYSNVVGLPLYETVALLAGEGYPVHFGWLNPP